MAASKRTAQRNQRKYVKRKKKAAAKKAAAAPREKGGCSRTKSDHHDVCGLCNELLSSSRQAFVSCSYCDRWFLYDCVVADMYQYRGHTEIESSKYECKECARGRGRKGKEEFLLFPKVEKFAKRALMLKEPPLGTWRAYHDIIANKLNDEVDKAQDELKCFNEDADHWDHWELSVRVFRKPSLEVLQQLELLGSELSVRKDDGTSETCLVVNYDDLTKEHWVKYLTGKRESVSLQSVGFDVLNTFESNSTAVTKYFSYRSAQEAPQKVAGENDDYGSAQQGVSGGKKGKKKASQHNSQAHKAYQPGAKKRKTGGLEEEMNEALPLHMEDVGRAIETLKAAMRGSIAASGSGRPEDAVVIPKHFEEDFDELNALYRRWGAQEEPSDQNQGPKADPFAKVKANMRQREEDDVNKGYLEECALELINEDLLGVAADPANTCMLVYSLRMFAFSPSDADWSIVPCIIRSLCAHPIKLIAKAAANLCKRSPDLTNAIGNVKDHKWKDYRGKLLHGRQVLDAMYKKVKLVKLDIRVQKNQEVRATISTLKLENSASASASAAQGKSRRET